MTSADEFEDERNSIRDEANGIGADDDAEGLTIECTDLRNSERFLEFHAVDVRFVGTWGNKCLCWDGRRWALDQTGTVLEHAKDTARVMAEEAAARCKAAEAALVALESSWLTLTPRQRVGRTELYDRKKQLQVERLEAEWKAALALKAWAKTSQMEKRLLAMIAIAQSDPRVAITHTMLDVDGMLFNVKNGTIDLRTAKLQPHRREDLITRLSPVVYDPNAQCPRFAKFMEEITVGDAELIHFHKLWLGYCMTAETREQSFSFWYGTGGNGKSVLAVLLMWIWADYAIKAMPDMMFRSPQSEAHTTELCDLHLRRMVFCNETQQGRVLDDGRIKDLTGSEPIRARRMKEDSWQWPPTHKLILFGQYKPTLRTVDDGMRRRTKLVPFRARFEGDKRDKTLERSLKAEASGILTWLVEGAAEWWTKGMPACKAVDVATASYFLEEDVVGAFFASECVFHTDGRVTRKNLREVYTKWVADRGDEKALGAKAFSQAVRDRGGTERSVRDAGGKPRDGWHGVRLPDADERARKDTAADDAAPPPPMRQTDFTAREAQ